MTAESGCDDGDEGDEENVTHEKGEDGEECDMDEDSDSRISTTSFIRRRRL